jgi:hypothetical protein
MAAGFNVEAAIAEFLADSARASLELPHMTTGQRKHAKKAVDLHPELTCVSYGLGQERQLHVFRKGEETERAVQKTEDKTTFAKSDVPKSESSTVSVPNTFIDDWIVAKDSDVEVETVVRRSLPPRLPRFECLEEYDLASIKENMCEDTSPYLSTAASSSGSIPGSPRLSEREALSSARSMHPASRIEVRNTFIHFEDMPAADVRAVQSMPHDMFRRCLLSEVSEEQVTKSSRVPDASSRPVPLVAPSADATVLTMSAKGCTLAPGTQVVIDGLLKLPAFNGLFGTVQSLDEETGRYNILLSSPAGGHKSAKVKGDNLLMVLQSPPPCFPPAVSLEQCESPQWGERNAVGHPLLLSAMV